MNPETAAFVTNVIAERLGLSVAGTKLSNPDGDYCEFVPADGHPNETFAVKYRLGWRSAEAFFVAGEFAGQLLAQMGKCDEEAKQAFVAYVRAASANKLKIAMRVNGSDVDAGQPSGWPTDWRRFELSVKSPPLVVEPDDHALHIRLGIDLVVPLFGMIVSLVGVEEEAEPTIGEKEGKPFQTLVTRYERKRVNREACLQLKGRKCAVCGFDFGNTYGELGAGYIEVHHIVPVSAIGQEYCINIEKDLEPLCANCHAMVHRENPPVALECLRKTVDKMRGKQD